MKHTLLLALLLQPACFADEDIGHNVGGDGDTSAPDDAAAEDFEILVRGPKFAHDVVSDADNLYWVCVNQSVDRSSIHRIAKAGGDAEELWLVGKRIYNISADDTHVYAAVHGVNPVGLGDLARVPKAGGEAEILVAGVSYTDHVAVDDAFAYYSHSVDGTPVYAISRVSKTGGAPELLITDLEGGVELAVDDTYLYYTENNGGRVMRVAKAGGTSDELAGGWVAVKYLVLREGQLYFKACSTGSCPMSEYYRVALDGSGLTLLASAAAHEDFAVGGDTLVLADRGAGAVYAVPLATGVPNTLVSGQPGPFATAIDADGARAYWVDFDSGDVGRVGVFPAEK